METEGVATEEDLIIARDWAAEHGMITGPANEGERLLVYTPTFIAAGLVVRVGPTCIELSDAGIVFDTGAYEKAYRGEFKDFESWPTVIRIPISAIVLTKVYEPGKKTS